MLKSHGYTLYKQVYLFICLVEIDERIDESHEKYVINSSKVKNHLWNNYNKGKKSAFCMLVPLLTDSVTF